MPSTARLWPWARSRYCRVWTGCCWVTLADERPWADRGGGHRLLLARLDSGRREAARSAAWSFLPSVMRLLFLETRTATADTAPFRNLGSGQPPAAHPMADRVGQAGRTRMATWADLPGRALGVVNRTILRHPPGQAPIVLSGRRRLPEKGVEKPGCPTTPAPPFPVRPGVALTRRHAGADHDDLLAPAGEPDRRADRVRPGVHVRADPRPADPRPDRGRLHPGVRRQAVGQDRRPSRARRVPGLPPRRRHPGRAEPGPALAVPAGPDHPRGRAAPPRRQASGPAG